MKKIRIGILGAADIAGRRFLPALTECSEFEFVGIAVADVQERGIEMDEESFSSQLNAKRQKAAEMAAQYGGKVYDGYEKLLRSEEIDAVYIPLPPALHYRWGKLALTCGKHVFLEKPGTTQERHTRELAELAAEKKLALCENYAFCYHRQVEKIRELAGEIGGLRLVRAAFGFPHRDSRDFRYDARMGGGALLDCGGYTLKAASLFLGAGLDVAASRLHRTEGHDVDIFGSATLENRDGMTAQLSFGMDNAYRCELELWGSRGYLTAPRFFTPPADLEVTINLNQQGEQKIIKVEADDQFRNMIKRFAQYVSDPEEAGRAREELLEQSRLTGLVLEGTGKLSDGEEH